MATLVVKGLASLQDFSQGNGTFTRATSTGGTSTLSQVPLFSGTGSPEGVVTAGVGCIYSRKDGSGATALYVKGSGAGNTGWQTFTIGGLSNVGLASSVSYLGVSGSPLSTNGTMTLTAASGITQNQVLASPDGTSGTMAPRALVAADIPTISRTSSIEFIVDGGGATITTGVKGDVEVPVACTITQATLLADQSGSIVVNVWKDTYANFPPTVADKITASAPPTISTNTKAQDATLTGWTKSISAGDILRFNVDSVTTIQRVTLSLKVTIP